MALPSLSAGPEDHCTGGRRTCAVPPFVWWSDHECGFIVTILAQPRIGTTGRSAETGLSRPDIDPPGQGASPCRPGATAVHPQW